MQRKYAFPIISILVGIFLSFALIKLIDVGMFWTSPPPTSQAQLNKSNGKSTHNLVVDGKTIYDYTFETIGGSSFRKRKLSSNYENTEKEKHLILLGGSFTWGVGLKDHETMDYHLSKVTSRAIYNYSIAGAGPSRMLFEVNGSPILDDVKPRTGDTLFIMIEDHLGRVTGDLQHMIDMYDSPYYDYDKSGTLQYRGSFQKGRPFWTSLFRLIVNISFLRNTGINYPSPTSEKSLKLTCDVLRELRNSIHKKLPNSRFTVLMYPGQELNADLNFEKTCFKTNSINFIRYTDFFKGEDSSKYFFPYDWHPTPKMAKRMAHQIAKDLDFKQ